MVQIAVLDIMNFFHFIVKKVHYFFNSCIECIYPTCMYVSYLNLHMDQERDQQRLLQSKELQIQLLQKELPFVRPQFEPQ